MIRPIPFSEGYVLESDDSFNFSTHNETSKENIFTIPMDKNIYTTSSIISSALTIIRMACLGMGK